MAENLKQKRAESEHEFRQRIQAQIESKTVAEIKAIMKKAGLNPAKSNGVRKADLVAEYVNYTVSCHSKLTKIQFERGKV